MNQAAIDARSGRSAHRCAGGNGPVEPRRTGGGPTNRRFSSTRRRYGLSARFFVHAPRHPVRQGGARCPSSRFLELVAPGFHIRRGNRSPTSLSPIPSSALTWPVAIFDRGKREPRPAGQRAVAPADTGGAHPPARPDREGWLLFSLVPQLLAFVYYQLSWLLYVVRPVVELPAQRRLRGSCRARVCPHGHRASRVG